MMRNALATIAALAVMLVAYGCGGGYSEDRATQQCDSEKAARGASCFDPDSFSTCVPCYQYCGDDCVPTGCPVRYYCPGDEPTQSTTSGTPAE